MNENLAPVTIPTLCRYEHFKRCIESLSRCTLADKTEVYVALDYPAKESHWDGYNKIKDYLLSHKEDNLGFKKLIVIQRSRNYGLGEEGNIMTLRKEIFSKSSNPQPIGFSGILLAKRQNSFYCTYFLHNRNVADTKSPYPIKRLEVIRWFNQKSMVFNQSLS